MNQKIKNCFYRAAIRRGYSIKKYERLAESVLQELLESDDPEIGKKLDMIPVDREALTAQEFLKYMQFIVCRWEDQLYDLVSIYGVIQPDEEDDLFYGMSEQKIREYRARRELMPMFRGMMEEFANEMKRTLKFVFRHSETEITAELLHDFAERINEVELELAVADFREYLASAQSEKTGSPE